MRLVRGKPWYLLLSALLVTTAGCPKSPPGGGGDGSGLGDGGGGGGDGGGGGGDGGGGGGDGGGTFGDGGGNLGDGGQAFSLLSISPSVASRQVDTVEVLSGSGFQSGATITLTSCFDVGTGPLVIQVNSVTVAGGGTSATFTLTANATRPQGAYTVTLTNPDNTRVDLTCGLTVSALDPPTVTQVQPGSAYRGQQGDNVLSDQAVSITGTGFLPTPAVELRNLVTGQRFEANAVNWLSATSLTAVIPSESQSMPVGDYELRVINPNLLSGTWATNFRVTSVAPPRITAINPPSIGGCPVTITLTGTGFQTGLRASFIVPPGTTCPAGSTAGTDTQGSATCSLTVNSVDPNGTSASVTATSCLGLGSYPIEVQNPDNQYSIFQSFSFIPSAGGHFGGGGGWEPGPDPANTTLRWPMLNAARWRHGFQYGFDEFGNTWLFAAGGQSTVNGAPLATIEIAQLDVFGRPGPWRVSQQFRSATEPRVDNTLGGLGTAQGRTGLEFLRVGRFLYAIGGSSVNTNTTTLVNAGTQGVLNTVERAEILGYETQPQAQRPTFTVGTGLPRGTWYYRISGVSAQGESLASVAVLAQNAEGVVHLAWSAPRSGTPTSYNIYRSLAADGRASSERLLATGVTATTFDDTGVGNYTPAPGRLSGSVAQGGSLVNGTYSYRVSACRGTACNDADRSSETLAGYVTDVVIDGTSGRSVALTWNPIPNAVYRVFRRNATSGNYEQVAKDVTDAQLPWVDNGTATPNASLLARDGIAPLQFGALSTWTTLPQQLVRPREGLDGVVLRLSSGQGAIYVGGGRSSTARDQDYLTTIENTVVDPATGNITAWKEQTAHPMSTARAFFALFTTQDRDITPTAPPPAEPPCPDFDGDGFMACFCYTGTATATCGAPACDCNDGDPTIYPCAADVCGDGIAQDCQSDRACPTGCQTPDADRDGRRSIACGGDDCCDTGQETGVPGCRAGTASTIYPGANDICGDGIDQDCSGQDPTCQTSCTTDADNDGHIACSCFPQGPPTTVTCAVNGTNTQVPDCDCNDNDPLTYPCATDPRRCDGVAQNCVRDICIIGRPTQGGGGALTSGGTFANTGASALTCGDGGALAAGSYGAADPNLVATAAPNTPEWLIAVGGGQRLVSTGGNPPITTTDLNTIEGCLVDTVSGDIVKCDAAGTANAPWAIQLQNSRPVGIQRAEVGLDGVLYNPGGGSFLITWPATDTETLGSAPAIDNGTASRFDAPVDVADPNTLDPTRIIQNFQSNSSKFTDLRSYYRMVRVNSYIYVLGGYTAGGVTRFIERHQQ
ncbi:MAG TPA: putative metal-binding motif-containing protein [Polyangia bacterium]|nr:putative metal-binding motif-containing protein [Polyangia bacterium]